MAHMSGDLPPGVETFHQGCRTKEDQDPSDCEKLRCEPGFRRGSWAKARGYCVTKPEVIFKLEQEEPWMLEEESQSQSHPASPSVILRTNCVNKTVLKERSQEVNKPA
eukprot:XP_028337421.1 zinc finger protein 510-like isoform X2 [Physeter catodon]